MIQCNKETCKMRYIGESDRELKKRLSEHKGYINNNKITQATGFHFNQAGHSLDNMQITILEKVRKQNIMYRKEREKFLIKKFNTFYKGINRMP